MKERLCVRLMMETKKKFGQKILMKTLTDLMREIPYLKCQLRHVCEFVAFEKAAGCVLKHRERDAVY